MAISLKRSPSDRESTLLISLSFLLHRSQWIVDGARGHAEREPSAVGFVGNLPLSALADPLKSIGLADADSSKKSK